MAVSWQGIEIKRLMCRSRSSLSLRKFPKSMTTCCNVVNVEAQGGCSSGVFKELMFDISEFRTQAPGHARLACASSVQMLGLRDIRGGIITS